MVHNYIVHNLPAESINKSLLQGGKKDTKNANYIYSIICKLVLP